MTPGEHFARLMLGRRMTLPRHRRQAARQERGFSGELLDSTPSLHISPDGIPRVRGDEIRAWLDACDSVVETFVILDDDGEMSVVSDRLGQTRAETGLQRSHIDRALELLGC